MVYKMRISQVTSLKLKNNKYRHMFNILEFVSLNFKHIDQRNNVRYLFHLVYKNIDSVMKYLIFSVMRLCIRF